MTGLMIRRLTAVASVLILHTRVICALPASCVKITHMVNSTTKPWTMYWTPPLSALSGETCAEISSAVKISGDHVLELARGLKETSELTKLTLGFRSSYGGGVRNATAMDDLFTAMRQLPIADFALSPSLREYWPDDVVLGLLNAVPMAKTVSLHLDDIPQKDDTVAKLVSAFPPQMRALKISLQNTRVSAVGMQAFATGFGGYLGFSRLKRLDLDMRSVRQLSSESKISVFKALQARGYVDCSLRCDNIVMDVAAKAADDSTLASVACIGNGNCNKLTMTNSLLNAPMIGAFLVCVATFVISVACYVIRNRRAPCTSPREMVQSTQARSLLEQEMQNSCEASSPGLPRVSSASSLSTKYSSPPSLPRVSSTSSMPKVSID